MGFIFQMAFLVVQFRKDDTVSMGLAKWIIPGDPIRMRWSSQITSEKRLKELISSGASPSKKDPSYVVRILHKGSKSKFLCLYIVSDDLSVTEKNTSKY